MVTFGFPEVQSLPICKHDGSVLGEWAPKPFRHMCLPGFLTEVGMRLPQPWMLPVDMSRRVQICSDNGVTEPAHFASAMSENHGWFTEHFTEEERAAIARLLDSDEFHVVWKHDSLHIAS
jgi:hypothetical protein